MSEFKGLWAHKVNGELCVRPPHSKRYVIGEFDSLGYFRGHSVEDELPEEFVPLVSQTEVDAVKAELETLRERQRVEPVFHCVSHKCGACSGCKSAGVENETARLEAELAETKASLELSDAALAQAKAAPSLPAVDFKDTEESLPQKLRAAAYLVDMQFDRLRSGDTSVAQILYDEADRLEREQAEKAKRDNLVEELTAVMYANDGPAPTVRALLDRFDITPKDAS